MKHCYRCKTDRPLEEYSKNKTKPDGLQNYCNHCKREIQNAHYKASAERRRKVKQRREDARAKAQQFLRKHLEGHPCVDCGEDDLIVLEFDHIRGTKSFNIGIAAGQGKSTDELQAEIDKCEVRCANCHRRRTSSRGNHWRSK